MGEGRRERERQRPSGLETVTGLENEEGRDLGYKGTNFGPWDKMNCDMGRTYAWRCTGDSGIGVWGQERAPG